jgi:hypothetical protein
LKHREQAITKEHKKQLELDKVTIKNSGDRTKITQVFQLS